MSDDFDPNQRITWLNLPDDVMEELCDPAFRHRLHHSKATYRDGCRGPLCRKADREARARKRDAAALLAGRTVNKLPVDKRRPGDIYRDDLLNKIYAWHILERSRPEGMSNLAKESVRPWEAESEVGSDEPDGHTVRGRYGLPRQDKDHPDSPLRSVPA